MNNNVKEQLAALNQLDRKQSANKKSSRNF